MRYEYPIRFTVYGLTIAIMMLSGYYCLANWYDKDAGKVEFILGVLSGLLSGLLVPTKVTNNSDR